MGILVLDSKFSRSWFSPMTIDTFSKAVVIDILEVIGGLLMPPLLFLQLILLSKVKKVSQPRKSFMKGTVLN